MNANLGPQVPADVLQRVSFRGSDGNLRMHVFDGNAAIYLTSATPFYKSEELYGLLERTPETPRVWENSGIEIDGAQAGPYTAIARGAFARAAVDEDCAANLTYMLKDTMTRHTRMRTKLLRALPAAVSAAWEERSADPLAVARLSTFMQDAIPPRWHDRIVQEAVDQRITRLPIAQTALFVGNALLSMSVLAHKWSPLGTRWRMISALCHQQYGKLTAARNNPFPA